MPESLIDFGQIANTAINMGQLQQTQRHNDILQQGMNRRDEDFKLDKDRLQFEKDRLKQGTTFRAFDEIEKLAKQPQYQTNPSAQIDLRLTQVNMLKYGLGIDIPVPSREELLGAHEQFAGLVKALRGDDPVARRAATESLMVAAPGFAKQIFDAQKEAGEMDAQGELLKGKIAVNQAYLSKLNLQSSRYQMQQTVFGEHLGALGSAVRLADDPRFKDHVARLSAMTQPPSRQAYLKLHPEFAEAWNQAVGSSKKPVDAVIAGLQDEVGARMGALRDAQTKSVDGAAPAVLAEEVTGYQQVLRARQVQQQWIADPFNGNKLKALRKAEQDVRLLHLSAGKRLSSIADERLSFANRKFDVGQQEKLAESHFQEQFLTHITAGKDDNQAAVAALADVHKAFPGVPVDTGKLKNMNKVGKQEIGFVKMGQEDVSRNLKLIDASQGVIDYSRELSDRIRMNPMIIGKGAEVGAAFAGAGQQLRAIAQLDPQGAKLLNTKTRDEAESFHEILVYMQAKSMDPTGALDLKVVENARKVIGDLSSFTTGPEQTINKLNIVTTNAERNMRRARRNLKGGVAAALDDPAPVKPLAEMNEAELMKTILQGIE